MTEAAERQTRSRAFEVLSVTGLRRGELFGLMGRDLHLDGEHPYIHVQREIVYEPRDGDTPGRWSVDVPKYGSKRRVPIPWAVADKLRALKVAQHAYVFPNRKGGHLDPSNVLEDVLKPACEEAGVEWASFKTLRTTVATRIAGRDSHVKRVQRILGHKDVQTTLNYYVKLRADDLGEPLPLLQVGDRSAEGSETTGNVESLESFERAA